MQPSFRRPTQTILLAVVCGALGSPTAALAQTFEGARSLALAEAQRAFGTGNDALYVNPGGLALGNSYSVEVSGLDDLADGDRRFNASVADSHEKPIAGAIGYTFRDRLVDVEDGGKRRNSAHRFDLGIATRITEGIALGVSARYLTVSQRLGDTGVAGGYNVFTIDAGLQWQSASGFALGITGYNLTNPDVPEVPISWGLGAGYKIDAFSFEGDLRYNAKLGKPRFSGGLAYVIGDSFPLRAGIAYDLATESAAFSVGLGYLNGSFGIDLGFRQKITGSVAPGLDSERILGLSIRALPFS